MSSIPTDVEIANNHVLEPIAEIAKKAQIPDDALVPYGEKKAKIDTTKLDWSRENGKLVLVTGVSPTPAGEGKSTTLIGLTDALAQAGKNAMVAIREPSLGPVMGIKGGAAGGGYSQIVPMDEINLHFNGDFHAITSANNTLAAIIDNHIHQGNELGIDPRRVTWQRCEDVNDRSLRSVVTGLGGPGSGTPREAGFTITAASEIMAIVGLSTDLADLRKRLGDITVGYSYDKQPVTARELKADGALTVLLKDALQPNLVQTLGGVPALVHTGPFGNIAHGCNSVLATKVALNQADIVLTEAGFGSDLGAEKFFDIKARHAGLNVDAAVVVATIRSLKFNGGIAKTELGTPNVEALRAGVVNLEQHVNNVRQFGVRPVVALNIFGSDSEEEIQFMHDWAKKFDVDLAESTVFANGGAGAKDLADKVLANLNGKSTTLYDPADGVEESIATIAKNVYGAANVEYSVNARKDLDYLRECGWDKLPVCISKTQYSFSDDPSQLGAPQGHTLHVRKLLPRTGAGFVLALTGEVMTMPGLPKRPAAERIDITADGVISGLS